jgi:hypothetical protein
MEQFEDVVEPKQLQEEYKWVIDTFPALHKYKTEHSTDNFQKLCVEVSQFCRAIYASTQNEAERRIYFDMLDKLRKR